MINAENTKKYIDTYSGYLGHNSKIFEIIEGDLLDKIKANLRQLLLSNRAYEAASKLIPPINLLRQVNSKLSTIYNQPPKRTASEDKDQFLLDYYENYADVNTAFHEANKFFNSQKVAALEPYLDGGKPNIRALSGHHFLARSTHPVNPTKITEFIKLVSDNVTFVYTKNEFKAIDKDGREIPEYMSENTGVNPFGIIPQTYIRRSRNLLIPLPDTDTIQMAVLIPSQWASLNYAINFQAHSVLYGIDIDFENIELNPDSFLVLKSDSDKKPEIGSIKPDIDISEVDKHILDLFNAWLESMNIRPGEGTGNSQNSVSGVALSIKEMDTTQNRREQIRYFTDAENEFWLKLAIQHNYWVDTKQLKDVPKFTENFSPAIAFPEVRLDDNEDKEIERQVILKANRWTTRRRSLSKLNPELTADEIEELIEEIDKEGPLEVSVNVEKNEENDKAI